MTPTVDGSENPGGNAPVEGTVGFIYHSLRPVLGHTSQVVVWNGISYSHQQYHVIPVIPCEHNQVLMTDGLAAGLLGPNGDL